MCDTTRVMLGSTQRSLFGVRAERLARILAALLLIGSLVLAGCSARKGTKPVPPGVSNKTSKQPAEQTALQAEFSKARIMWNDEKGRRVMDARFKEAVASQTGQSAVIELHDVKAGLYRDGKLAGTLIAPRVIADGVKKEVRASGGVRIISATEGATALCKEVTWKSRMNKFFGAGSVKLTKDNVSVNASSFQADTALKKARLTDAKLGIE